MTVAFALLIVAAGVAGCLWYFGEVQQDLDRQRDELRREAARLSAWQAQLVLAEVGPGDAPFDWMKCELDELGRRIDQLGEGAA